MKYQWLLILVLIGANIGCAKLGQTTITEDLLGEQADWLEGSSTSTDQLENKEKTEKNEVRRKRGEGVGNMWEGWLEDERIGEEERR